MNRTKCGYSPFFDRIKIREAEKILCEREDYYIFESFASNLISDKSSIFSERMYAFLEELLKSHEFRLEKEALKNALLNAQTKKPFDNYELYGIYRSIALIIFRNVPRLSDTQISGCAYTLRMLSESDFDKLFSEVSVLEKLLCENEIYRKSDRETKNIYRKSTEEYAKEHGMSDIEAFAETGLSTSSKGVPAFLGKMYFAVIAIFCVLLFVIQVIISHGNVILALLLILPSFEFSKQITELIYSKLINVPHTVPKYELSDIPDDAVTLVVITELLSDDNSELFSKLERCYLANNVKNTVFGALCDLPASDGNISPNDEKMISDALEHTENLKRRYGNKFCLLVRRRSYSASEKKYMGWERKRGAILELVREIKGRETSFSVKTADPEFIHSVKYIITLDSDTELGIDKVKILVGAMLHPSNAPVISDGTVKSGYGLMQPNISTSLLSEISSDFSFMLCGGGGTDVYSSASFDIYQTVFGEGSFCGKGIFDVDCYYALLDKAFAQETVLSHDLLEGARLRTAYLSDVTLTDSCPTGVLPYFKRLHRWNRGDVQALAYASQNVRGEDGKLYSNPISKLSKYKIYDNIRRIFTPVFALLNIIISGLIWGERALSTALTFSLLYLVFPAITSFIFSSKNLNRRFFSNTVPSAKRSIMTAFFNVCALLHTSYVSLDSAVRAFFRMNVSHSKMLQWTTASEADKMKSGLWKHFLLLSDSIIGGALLLLFYPFLSVKLLGILFMLFPLWGFLLSVKKETDGEISASQKNTLTKYAFDMWKFYRDNATEEDNYLPPDNIQYAPKEATAHRTSPTNIGLCLLSTLAARDMGFIDSEELCKRISSTLSTIELLYKYNGNLLNWYDTRTLEPIGNRYVSTVDSGNFICCLAALKEGLYEYLGEENGLSELITEIERLMENTDLSVLYNSERKLFCISLDTESGKMSENCYDMLMSESRTTSYFAIAEGIAPKEHWAKLSRTLISSGGFMGLASWSGTAFEYFMPALFLPVYRNSLCYEALKFAFYEQSKMRKNGIFGKSESAYYAFDSDMNYQYKAHGIQSLGMAKGLSAEKVYAPYASFLALCVSKNAAFENLRKMKDMGFYGRYGFYEAIDFTPKRSAEGMAVIRSFMAHHVGMSIIACTNACCGNIFVKRFMSNRHMNAASELLTEKVPTDARIYHKKSNSVKIAEAEIHKSLISERTLNSSSTVRDGDMVSAPAVSLISNGSLSLVCSSDGSIFLREKEVYICGKEFDDIFSYGGIRFYILADGKTLSVTKSAYMMKCDNMSVRYKSNSKGIKTEVLISLDSTCGCMAASVSVSGNFCEICPMLCFEPKLCCGNDFSAHPSYRRLFTESFFDKEEKILFFRYRGEPEIFCAVSIGSKPCDFEFITEKSDFLPLMYSEYDMEALAFSEFDCMTGPCTDPFCAVKKASVSNGGKYRQDFLISIGKSREEAENGIRSARKSNNSSIAERLRHSMYRTVKYQMYASMLDTSSLRLSGLLLSSIYYRLGPTDSIREHYGKNTLYAYGISGDIPIITVCVGKGEHISDQEIRLCRDFVHAHKYLMSKGEIFDLVFICIERDAYSSSVSRRINALCEDITDGKSIGKETGIFIIGSDLTSSDNELFKYASRLYCNTEKYGSTDELYSDMMKCTELRIRTVCSHARGFEDPRRTEGLIEAGSGIFTANGFICEKKNRRFPHSFCYCGAQFGTVLSQNSLGYTYWENSREKRITERNEDAYHEVCGERLLLFVNQNVYDMCACSERVYFTKSCAVYSGTAENIRYRVYVGCDTKYYAKLVSIELTNCGITPSDIKIHYETVYALGAYAPKPELIIKKSIPDGELACNSLSQDGSIWAYKYCIGGDSHIISGQAKLSVGFVFGVCHGEDSADLRSIRSKYRSTADIERAFLEYANEYTSVCSAFKMKSKLPSLDIITGFYAPYQVLCDRMRARSGFWQPGGAYGFRDQLQDSISLLTVDTSYAMRQIARCCVHQYEEGDVMHWWHNDGGNSVGIRTRISDDPVWLAYAICEYTDVSLDTDFLKKEIFYIRSLPLSQNEKDRYESAVKSNKKETVYMHGARALDLALSRLGAHGLPLFGSGDWNDGMNEVGAGGESVWLGMFLKYVLRKYAKISEISGDAARCQKYGDCEKLLLENIEKYGYSGSRYIRGYYGDGKAFGTENDPECAIDLIPQAFSYLCGCDKERVNSAFTDVAKYLYDGKLKTLSLLSPPFNGLDRNIGYIGQYPPGIRENGGEYCHAACFFAYALIKSGRKDAAYEVLKTVNPIDRYLDPALSGMYSGEPYSVPADIMYDGRHSGQCGWSHYTGSAGWYYRIVLTEIIGIKRRGNSFSVVPAIPSALKLPVSFTYAVGRGKYTVRISSGENVSYTIDGRSCENEFYFDGKEHFVEVTFKKSYKNDVENSPEK